MKDPIVYNIPAAMADAYRGRNLIVRSSDPAELVRRLASQDPERIVYVQVLGTGGDIEELLRWDLPVPVDLAIEDPAADLPRLYRYSGLLADRPVRVSVPVATGFEKVVKLALSLNFAVKLDPSQPGPELAEALLPVLDHYLHQSTVARPVEYFHSVFSAFYHGGPLSLWTVQEEDPRFNRFVTERGAETISKRFIRVDPGPDPVSFLEAFTGQLLSERRECSACRFFDICLGHFKWPEKEYRCDGVKDVFEALREGAEELRKDLHPDLLPPGDGRP